jgi:hypothetical protein
MLGAAITTLQPWNSHCVAGQQQRYRAVLPHDHCKPSHHPRTLLRSLTPHPHTKTHTLIWIGHIVLIQSLQPHRGQEAGHESRGVQGAAACEATSRQHDVRGAQYVRSVCTVVVGVVGVPEHTSNAWSDNADQAHLPLFCNQMRSSPMQARSTSRIQLRLRHWLTFTKGSKLAQASKQSKQATDRARTHPRCT